MFDLIVVIEEPEEDSSSSSEEPPSPPPPPTPPRKPSIDAEEEKENLVGLMSALSSLHRGLYCVQFFIHVFLILQFMDTQF